MIRQQRMEGLALANNTNKANINIEDVVNVKELQDLQDNWAKATDLAFVTVDCNGKPITRHSNFTPFCEELRKVESFRERCYYCDACGGRKAKRQGKAYVYICHAGLIDFAIPITIDGQYVGAILAGQVKSPSYDNLKSITNQTLEWREDEKLQGLYEKIQTISVEKIKAVAQILCDSYNYSVQKEYDNKVEAALREKDFQLMKEEKLRLEMEKSLRDIELKALHYQINPHFLFNVLNTIGRLAFFENAKMTEDVVYSFADMMRYILRKSSDPLSSLRDEVFHVQNYLKVQKIRLGSRLQYTVDVPDKYMPVKFPFLSLTTIVENSIKYAVENRAAGGMVKIRAYEKNKNLHVEVEDNGDGIAPEKIVSILRGDAYKDNNQGSMGLYNISSRLIRLFGSEYALDVISENKPRRGTKVIIRVPMTD